ncbi:steroid 5-alpha-reductase DET2-like isoform X1 [Biomphalaria pfeifferi]|uniref:Steroid 5-alpha-reductase DET2-like isoform X1 n=1 Tax=Biomphalaria pfeifferi TaxID=112525 RepID=A0AAD8FMW7_BIOPF|nr:steroid 5-alpha-reductase DET2-like isoform X1 [Biomphalaria pfeifferi]
MMFEPIPYSFYKAGTAYFWVHFGLIILGFLISLATVIGQWANPAPYGKHQNSNAYWGPMIPQRLGHMISDAVPGVLLFSLVYFLYSSEENERNILNYVFFAMFLCHTVHRGIIHPLVMRYKNPKVALGIVLGGGIPNILYHWLNANHIAIAGYYSTYYYDPRFILGVLLYLAGFIINRWADWKLRSLRHTKGHSTKQFIEVEGSKGYYIPYGGLFEFVSCPNYFGELVQWIGWTLATWSLAGFVWTCFSCATFFARSRHNHQWYKDQFQDYPQNRKVLIPFLY